MGRSPISTSFVTPITAAGVDVAPTSVSPNLGRGTYTLAAGTTYFFKLGGQDCPVASSHFQFDAAIVITSATVEDCDMPDDEAPWHGVVAGTWIPVGDADSKVGVTAGAVATAGVVAVAGGTACGCRFNIADTGARRTRVKVVVGATGGQVRNSQWGKE